MKYIRTENGIISTKDLIKLETEYSRFKDKNIYRNKNGVLYEALNKADTIEELCDGFYLDNGKEFNIEMMYTHYQKFKNDFLRYKNLNLKIEPIGYGFIKTSKGLIYVAKMNNEGVLELI